MRYYSRSLVPLGRSLFPSLSYRGYASGPVRFSKGTKGAIKKPKQSSLNVVLPKFSTVANLATLFKIRFVDLQKTMEDMGFSDNHSDHIVDDESAQLISEELGINAVLNENHGDDIYPQPFPEDIANTPHRPPVIALMGHVDHGKTTLLDYFRSSHIAAGEKGGITQHIGAFSTMLKFTKQQVCFLDTPGHEAFLKLRERGAHSTDIVLLVVAADDSVMPQTKEAIKHAKAANVPMVVALTKSDLPESNPQRVIADLAAAGVDVEDYGGDTQCIPVSAVRQTGVEELESAIMALIEILDVRAPTEGNVEGVVVESQQAKGLGNVATVIVRRGVLKPRTTLVAGTTWCKVRSMNNENNKQLKTAPPGTPVQITGWKDLPEPGDTILEASTEDFAKKVAQNRARLLDEAKEAKRVEVINENRRLDHLNAQAKEDAEKRKSLGLEVQTNDGEHDGPEVLSYLVKADVGGSAEALTDSISELGNDEVKASVLFSAVGPVTENDIFRAQTAGASIIAFSTQVPRPIERLAEKNKVTIHRYDVIYKALEMISAELSSKLKPEVKRDVIGTADIREVFSIQIKKSRKNVAGIKVTKGSFTLKSRVQIMRDGEKLYDGKFSSIQHGRDTVEQAHKNSEYGVSFDGWDKFERGDVIESYEETSIPRYL